MTTYIRLIAAILIPLATLVTLGVARAEAPAEIRIDYAYYSPTSLVLKRFGWLEEDLKGDKVAVKWVLSQGSNRALEFLKGNSVDFGSAAGLASVLSKANGNPIKAVYIPSRPEWTALVVTKDSPITSIKDLKGKKVAATKGTDPFLFTLRALRTEGLKKSDIEHVSLQHADGRAALEKGDVDAWAGLDPLMAASEIDAGSRLIYRNVDFNTYCFLNTTETFAKEHPDYVKKVIAAYEKARKWTLEHPEETAKIVAEEAKISLPVAKLQLSRNDFSNPVPGKQHAKALKSAAPILIEEELVKKGTNVDLVIDQLVEPTFAKAVVR